MENQGKAADAEALTQEGQEQEGQAGAEGVNQDGSGKEEKLYAGVYKTPEELEQGYINSNREATRMAQEIKRLSTLAQQAPPKEKEKIEEKITDLTKHFDPDTAKILSGYFKNLLKTEFDGFQENSRVQGEFQKQVTDVWAETEKLFPDVKNQQSKLYVRANDILFERQLAEITPSGEVKLLTPFAYRIAVEAAYTELGRQASENAAAPGKKGRAGMIQGKGSKGFGGGKLSFEQYQKLSDDDKDAYDKSTTGR